MRSITSPKRFAGFSLENSGEALSLDENGQFISQGPTANKGELAEMAVGPDWAETASCANQSDPLSGPWHRQQRTTGD